MKKATAVILSSILALALLVYCGARSLDFVSSTLPPDKAILAYFAIAATEGGMLLWLLYFLHGASGMWQRGAALLMVVVDLLGSIALFTTDTLLRSSETGMVARLDQSTMQSIILAMSGVIALNVAATIFCHLTDPDAMKRAAEEEAQAQIEHEALAMIQENSTQLAKELAPEIAGAWKQDMAAMYRHKLPRGKAASKASNHTESVSSEPDADPTKR